MTQSKEKFSIGDRVRENAQAPRSTRRTRDRIFRLGTVLGFPRGGTSSRPGASTECVRVKFDHYKMPEVFHMNFLDVVERAK